MKKLQIIPFTEINEQDWTELHKSSIDSVLFYQYPFINTYNKTTNKKIDLLLYKEDDSLLIALPGRFDYKKKIFYNLTYLGWDNLDFLTFSGIDKTTIKSFFKEVYKIVDLIIYKNINEHCYQIISEVNATPIVFKRFRCPFINLNNSYETYLNTLSVSFRRMVKNRINFCEKHGVKFRFLTNTNKQSFAHAFDELKRLHEIRMDKIDTESKFLKPNSQEFHKMIRENDTEEFILIIQAVENEKVIGTLYGFLSANQYAYFASGIDPSYSKYSLGIVMIAKIIAYLFSNNYKHFDFLRGTEDYKYKWTKEDSQNYTVYSFVNTHGRLKAINQYWQENKLKLGRKQTLINLKRFL